MQAAQQNNHRLTEELKRLQRLFSSGYELKVCWVPNPASKLEGEVKSETIFLYSGSLQEAKNTLEHEYVHYLVNKVAAKYQRIISVQRAVINELLESLAEEAYQEEEKLTDKFKSLLDAFDTVCNQG